MKQDKSKNRQSDETSSNIDKARAEWLENLKDTDSVGKAFDLELCLKAIDRFFNVQNLPLPEPEKAVTLNFVKELKIVLSYVEGVIELSRELMEAARGSQTYQFRRYVETTLLTDFRRTKIREASYEQKTPNESLFLLYTGFINIRGILRALIRGKKIAYSLYVNIGNLISREIISNIFFNPVGEIEFRPEFDRIENRKISRIVMRIPEENLKKQFSIIILIMFRLLRYLEHINPKTGAMDVLQSGMPIFSLVHSESIQLHDYLEKTIPGKIKQIEDDNETMRQDFLKICDSMSFQLSMELKKIYRCELLGGTRTEDSYALRGAVENSHGVLSNFFQQSIIQVVKVFEPHVEGRDIFPFYTSILRQSLQLRSDIWVFKELMDKFEEQAETNPDDDTQSIYIKYLRILKDYILYFRYESHNLLRYDDMREFNNFFEFMDALSPRDIKEPEKLNDFIYKTKFFKIYLETTLGNIALRSELKNRPIDYRACERFLKEFILASMKKMVRKLETKKKIEKSK